MSFGYQISTTDLQQLISGNKSASPSGWRYLLLFGLVADGGKQYSPPAISKAVA